MLTIPAVSGQIVRNFFFLLDNSVAAVAPPLVLLSKPVELLMR
jgi:hypothetical protein